MAEFIPFTPGNPNETLEVTLDGKPYVMVTRWNSTDNNKTGAFYLDLYTVSLVPICTGMKIVLGALLGRRCTHPFFVGRALFAYDKSNSGRECGVDDLGGRIQVAYLTESDLLLAQSPRRVIPK